MAMMTDEELSRSAHSTAFEHPKDQETQQSLKSAEQFGKGGGGGGGGMWASAARRVAAAGCPVDFEKSVALVLDPEEELRRRDGGAAAGGGGGGGSHKRQRYVLVW